MNDKTEFCYKETLEKTYGLNPQWIERLGEPDKRVVNPHNRLWSKASLYRRERVERFIEENQAEWDALQIAKANRVKRVKRPKPAKESRDEKRAALVAWASEVEIKFAEIPQQFEELKHHVKEHGLARYFEFIVSPNAVIAYVRHNATNYDYLVPHTDDEEGGPDAYLIIKQRVNKLVGNHLIERYGDDWQIHTETQYGYGHRNS